MIMGEFVPDYTIDEMTKLTPAFNIHITYIHTYCTVNKDSMGVDSMGVEIMGVDSMGTVEIVHSSG